MNVFKFVTPLGQTIEMNGPAGSTQDQARAIFDQQYSTGSLSGLRAGDILNSLVQAKGGLATALSQVTGSITPSTISQIGGALNKIPNLPALNPTTISNFVNTQVLAGSAVGPLSTTQIQGLLSSTSAAVNQLATEVTNEKGLGKFGLSADQLQLSGLIKPGTAELINQDPATLVDTLSSPTVWTGRGGADSLDSVLANPTLQGIAQQSCLASSYNSLSELGVVSNTVNNLFGSDKDLGAVVNNAANYGVGAATEWLNNTLGGSDIGQLTTSAIESVFGMSFGSVNQSVSGGGNPLQTGVQSPRGYSNTVNRSVIDTAFNSIIGNNKIPANIFANPSLGIDIRTQATQLSTINQSSSILLTQLASSAAGVSLLSQIPSANSIMSLLKSGQGLISEIKGAAQLLDQAKNLPGVGALLADIPGSGEVLGSLQSIGSDLFKNGAEALGLDPKELAAAGLDLLGLDVTTLTGLDASALLGGSETVIAEAAPLAETAVEFIASFW
jgi:hypothetical protein